MIGLLIFLSLFIIGKIHGQDVIIPQIINVQFLSPPLPLNQRTRPVIIVPELNWQIEEIQTVLLRNPMQRADYTYERSTPNQTGSSTSSLNLSPPPTVSENTQIFSTQKNSDRMNRPGEEASSNTSVGNAKQNTSNIDRVNLEEKTKPMLNLKPSQVTSEANRNETTTGKIPFVLPPVLNETVVNPVTNTTSIQPVDKNGTKVTFDERASFTGDQCPTGYVKVNGKCVEAD